MEYLFLCLWRAREETIGDVLSFFFPSDVIYIAQKSNVLARHILHFNATLRRQPIMAIIAKHKTDRDIIQGLVVKVPKQIDNSNRKENRKITVTEPGSLLSAFHLAAVRLLTLSVNFVFSAYSFSIVRRPSSTNKH